MAARLWIERKAPDHAQPYPENPYAGEFIWIEEHIMRLMEKRTIPAWHYTGMTDKEVAALRRDGVDDRFASVAPRQAEVLAVSLARNGRAVTSLTAAERLR